MKQKRNINLSGVEAQSAKLSIPNGSRDVVTEELAKYKQSGANTRQLYEIKAGIAESFETSTINYSEADVRANMRLIALNVLEDTIDLYERTESTRKAIADIGEMDIDSEAA